MRIEFTATEFEDEREAIRHAEVIGNSKAIMLQGAPMVVSNEDADRLAAAGIEFAFLSLRMTLNGSYQLITVPVN